jgi:HEPN domain-containing protein
LFGANTGIPKSKFMKVEFNEWDGQPISLSPRQINNPLLVINYFFNVDSLDGHLKRLTLWRDFILKDASYRNGKEGPLSLYSFYKTNIELIDGAYLLLKSWPENAVSHACSSNLLLPLNSLLSGLSDAELLEVYSALSSMFACFSLPQYRDQLEEWLENGLSIRGSEGFLNAKDFITVYENLQRLYSAVWILYFHERLKLEDTADVEKIIQDKNLYQLDSSINSDQYEFIRQMVKIISLKLPATKAIMYLGKQPLEDGKLYLLVIVADEEQRLAQSLSSMIEESCAGIAPVVALVHHAHKFVAKLKCGNSFFNYANNCPVVYMSGDQLIPSPKPLNKFTEQIAFKWERWLSQGKHFLAGADFFIKNDMHGAGLFLIHQAAECVLMAVVRGILGYDTNSHNISRLLMLSEMFTTGLTEVFKLNEVDSKARFEILKNAYIAISYRDTFEPDTEAIELLYQDINKLVTTAEDIYNKWLLANSL